MNATELRQKHAETLKSMQEGRRRCACMSRGTWTRTIGGTIGYQSPALWASCANCRGTAIGGGLEGTTRKAAINLIAAAKRCGESIDAWVDEA